MIICRSDIQASYEFPAENYRLKFRRCIMCMPITYVIYYDFISYHVPDLTPEGINTIIAHELVPASFSLVVVQKSGENVKVIHSDFYEGEN